MDLKTTSADRKIWNAKYSGSETYSEQMLRLACDDIDTLSARCAELEWKLKASESNGEVNFQLYKRDNLRCAKLEEALGVAVEGLSHIKEPVSAHKCCEEALKGDIDDLFNHMVDAADEALTRIKEITGETAKGDGG